MLHYLSQRIGLWTLNLPQGHNAPWTDLLILCNSTFSSCRAEQKCAYDYVWFHKGFFKVFSIRLFNICEFVTLCF